MMHINRTYFSRLLLSIFVAGVFNYAAQANNLSPTEQKIVEAVKAHFSRSIDLLERSAKINSGTLNVEGVRAVGNVFRPEFDQLGFKTHWVDMPAEMERAGHLIAERRGTQGKRILLIGHLDTVFEKNSSVPMWVRHDNNVFGQGVLDMKSGDVIIVAALHAIHKIGALDNTQIQVILIGDEEQSGSPLEVARGDLINAAKRSDVALAFEHMLRDQQGNDTATTSRRAIGSFSLHANGQSGHSANIFKNNDGAIYEIARILNSFREQLIEPGLTFNVGAIVGGTEAGYTEQTNSGTVFGKKNVIPQIAIAEGDLRYLTAQQRDHAYIRMQEIVTQHLPGTKAKISFREIHPPMSPTDGNKKLLAMYSQASQDGGLGKITPVAPALRGAGDIQFAAPYVDSLDGLGATGEGAHSDHEYVELESIERATIRAALLIYRLTR